MHETAINKVFLFHIHKTLYLTVRMVTQDKRQIWPFYYSKVL